jgi:hypothetical protein
MENSDLLRPDSRHEKKHKDGTASGDTHGQDSVRNLLKSVVQKTGTDPRTIPAHAGPGCEQPLAQVKPMYRCVGDILA